MKSKGHVYMANLILEVLEKPSQIVFPGIQSKNIQVPPYVKQCITNNKQFFRAGAVGPDFFPDLIFGQAIIHPTESGEWLKIMYDELLLIPPGTKQQQEAIAFYAGYMMHYAGDMFTHDYVNRYAGGWFPDIMGITKKLSSGSLHTINDGIEDVKRIIRHIAVEKYLDDYIQKQTEKNHVRFDTSLDIPVDYLRRCFASKAALHRHDLINEIDQDTDVNSDFNFLKKYVTDLDDLYTDQGKDINALRERDAYINSWLRLWGEIANKALEKGTFDALDELKIDIARHFIAFKYENDRERREMESKLDAAMTVVGIVDIGIYIPGLSELMEWIEELIKDKLKSVAYPYIIDMAALISGKPKEEIPDFDSAINAVKERFVNVERMLEDPLLFTDYKYGELPKILRKEWEGMGASYTLKKISFPAFKNACKMGYLCLLGPDSMNMLLKNYDSTLGNYYVTRETSIGISSVGLFISTGGGKYDGTNKNLIVKICGEKTGGKENILDQFTVSGEKYLQKSSRFRLNFPTRYTIPLSKIDHFLLKLDGKNLWKTNYVSFFDGSTNIELTEWTGRMYRGDEICLPVRRDVAYHYETVSYSAKINTLAIEIKTSGARWSGTDDDVYFTVYANGGTYVQTTQLDKYMYNDFEAGDRDTYTMQLSIPKTYKEIDYFVLKKKGSDDWRVAFVMVYDMDSNECISLAQLNRKVGSGGITIEKGNSTLPADDDEEAGSAPNQAASTEQKVSCVIVTIKTADKFCAGTDNDVFFTTYYWDEAAGQEKSIEEQLDTSWHNDFERGDTDTFRVSFRMPIPRNNLRRFAVRKKGSDDWTIDWVKVQDLNTGACIGKYSGRKELRKNSDSISIPAG